MVSLLVFAQVVSGWAFLAGESGGFPARRCAQFAEASPAPFIAVLADTFGRSSKCLRAFMRASKGKPAYWQYYAGNGSGRRFGRLKNYEFLSDLSPGEYNEKLCSGQLQSQITRQAKRLRQRCSSRAHEHATCLISPELESQFSKCALNKWVKYAERAGWTREQIVHNPVSVSPYKNRGHAGIIERHGVLSNDATDAHFGVDGACLSTCGKCGVSGASVSGEHIKRWLSRNSNARNVYLSLWCSEHQGLLREIHESPEPRARAISVPRRAFINSSRLLGVTIQ